VILGVQSKNEEHWWVKEYSLVGLHRMFRLAACAWLGTYICCSSLLIRGPALSFTHLSLLSALLERVRVIPYRSSMLLCLVAVFVFSIRPFKIRVAVSFISEMRYHRLAFVPQDIFTCFKPAFTYIAFDGIFHLTNFCDLLVIHHAQFTVHNSPWHNSSHTIHRKKVTIPLDEFLILLVDC
jgi:hypothetical protein